jgi:hypothetical protein
MSARGGLWEVGERDRRWNCDSLILVLLAVLAVAVVVTVVGKTERKVEFRRGRSRLCACIDSRQRLVKQRARQGRASSLRQRP